jgi:hypothetical protein
MPTGRPRQKKALGLAARGRVDWGDGPLFLLDVVVVMMVVVPAMVVVAMVMMMMAVMMMMPMVMVMPMVMDRGGVRGGRDGGKADNQRGRGQKTLYHECISPVF